MKNGPDRAAVGLISHLRERGINDARALDAMRDVPREVFVGPECAGSAYTDTALPIECGQTISQPFIVAYMTEKLGVAADHEVLEIGTGSGYQAAVLARLCRHVCTIERHELLHRAAKSRFEQLGIENITAILGDGSKGWPEPRRFDRIIVTAAATELPEILITQLKPGGRMILPLGKRLARQRLVLVTKTQDGFASEDLIPVRFVPLVAQKN
jgi:protein-L-isoaspartate(D-aspartate) O-methyltransferase